MNVLNQGFQSQRFGRRDLPEPEGLNGSKICSFCDEWGSAAYHLERDKPLSEQIKINREAIRKRYRAERFLVYFQAYTNTLGKVQKLQDWFDAALMEKDVVGIVLGTRPDCLPSRVLKLFRNTPNELICPRTWNPDPG